MEDLRLWFLESRIRMLWPGVSDKSWVDFIVEESGKNKKVLKEFFDCQTREKVKIKFSIIFEILDINIFFIFMISCNFKLVSLFPEIIHSTFSLSFEDFIQGKRPNSRLSCLSHLSLILCG